MKKSKLTALMTAAAMLLASGCSGGTPAQTEAAPKTEPAAPAETTMAETTAAETTIAETTESSEPVSAAQKITSSLSMLVSGSDGKLTVTRAPKKTKSMGNSDTWTIFMYLCGSDLESDGSGDATSDVVQMLDATCSDNVKFVIQTGGTSRWMNEAFSADATERWVVQNQDTTLVDSVKLSNMGDPETLEEFLSWGVREYPAEKMGVILWDHGGGSINGVCFDELNDDDSLLLSEINTALSQVYANMTDKFEFIGFDCCLMGTAETANILATYAKYFYGSQETEPGTGWDYKAIGSFLAENPGADGAQLGKVVADSFYEECAQSHKEDECTFTIVDLDKFDEFVTAFNDYAKELYESASSDLAGIVRGVNEADNFGGNNKSEGYLNMVDIGGIIKNCSSYADGSAALKALDDCIVYNRNGSLHSKASGLSIYYPLQVQGSSELKIFSGISLSPYYLSLVDMVAKGYTDNGYSNEVFFTEDGDWSCEDCTCDYFEEDEYFDDYTAGGGESSLITFALAPTLTDEGNYGFVLDENGIKYTSNVRAFIYLITDDETAVELGETFDVIADWDNGVFTDNFDGYWLALLDGQLLPTYIADYSDEYIVYTSPIYLNGKRTNLRIKYDSSGIYIEGAWDGINENGTPSREIRELTAGDKIIPIYTLDDGSEYKTNEYVWQSGDNVVYSTLPAAEYYYGFDIEDIYGDFYLSDLISFYIDEDGSISYSE